MKTKKLFRIGGNGLRWFRTPSMHAGTEKSESRDISADEVLRSLEAILASPAFADVERPSRYLRHLVENALRGETAGLKESVLGVTIFGRPPSWDPRLNPVVRQEASRLRKRLARYYEDAADAPIRIELPLGTYVPVFRRAPATETPAPEEVPIERSSRHKWLWLGCLAAIAAAALIWFEPVRGTMSRLGTAHREAEQLYLKGRFLWNKRTPESLALAVDVFTQAVVRDPKYAPAYTGLADCYLLLREFSVMPDQEAYPRARAAALQALALDDGLAEAHNSLGFIQFWWNWNAVGAEKEFRRALELKPNYATAHQWYATFLYQLGRLEEAQKQIGAAQNLDPGSDAILADKALIDFAAGKREESLTLVNQMAGVGPGFSGSARYASWMYLALGDYPRYLAAATKAAAIKQDRKAAALIETATQAYERGGAEGMFTEMLYAAEKGYAAGQTSAMEVAVALARLGRHQEALRYLEIAFKRRESGFPDCCMFEPFKSKSEYAGIQARFEEILKTGLGR